MNGSGRKLLFKSIGQHKPYAPTCAKRFVNIQLDQTDQMITENIPFGGHWERSTC